MSVAEDVWEVVCDDSPPTVALMVTEGELRCVLNLLRIGANSFGSSSVRRRGRVLEFMSGVGAAAFAGERGFELTQDELGLVEVLSSGAERACAEGVAFWALVDKVEGRLV